MMDKQVPTRVIELAMTVWAIERFARGKRVTRATKKVPAIAITRGKIRLAFSTGSSLTRNKTVKSDRKQTVEDLDTTSARNLQDAGSFPPALWLLNRAYSSPIFAVTTNRKNADGTIRLIKSNSLA